MTPTTLDYLSDYADGVDRMPYQIRRVANTDGGSIRPAILDLGAIGAVPDNQFRAACTQAFFSYPSNVLAYDSNRLAGTSKQHRPRGSYKIMEMWVNDGGGG